MGMRVIGGSWGFLPAHRFGNENVIYIYIINKLYIKKYTTIEKEHAYARFGWWKCGGVVVVAKMQPPSKTSTRFRWRKCDKQPPSKASMCMLVFNCGSVVVVVEVANKQPPSKTSNVYSFSMAEVWWWWQTSSHHQKRAHTCSFSMVEVWWRWWRWQTSRTAPPQYQKVTCGGKKKSDWCE